jgi:hypothetical protein
VLPLYGTKFISIERIDENFIKICPTAAVTVYTVQQVEGQGEICIPVGERA